MLRAAFNHRAAWPLIALAVVAILMPIGMRQSQAAYVAQSTNPGNNFAAASSFNTVAVTLTDPGSPLRSVVMLNAVATSDRGISSVVFETSPAGANTWTTACTAGASPYGCSWDTTGVADGLRDVRVVATDSAGYTRTDTVTGRRVDNTGPTATTTDPGSPLTGTVSVSGSAVDGGSGVATTTLQYRPSGGGGWITLCSQPGASATCSWSTASLSDGLYDLRTLATDVAGNTGTSAVVANRRLDNVAPTTTMTAPAANLTGTITLQSTSADSGSGVASVRYEYKPSAGSTWTTACTGSTAPFSCSFNTSAASDGLYDFRAVAIDGVNLSGTSAAVTSRRIDNTDPTATMTAPAANLAGSVTLASTPADTGSGVASVRYEYKLSSGSTWTTACSSSTSPFSCSFDTTSVSDGLYDFRAVATDNVGRTGNSAAVTSRRIDNTDPSVTMTAPAANLTASVTLASTPGDGAGSGVASVRYEYKPSAGSTWTTACSSASSPYSCAFNTASVADGVYDFRAVATDNVGRTGTSAAVTSRRVDNTDPTVTMTAPAANLGGSVTLAATAADTGSGVASVRYEYKLSSGSTWTTACTGGTTPFSCAFNTGSLPDGLYDFRAVATDNVGRTATSAAVTSRRVDNTNPATATLGAVGTPLSGNVNFTGTATDNGGGSGIANWTVQYSPAGTNTWTALCSDATTPYACAGNVDAIADGLYDFRAVATDNAGNTLGSTVQTNRRIDTDGPVVSITSPANNARVSGTITMTAAASDPVGVASVDFQYLAGATWVTICTDNTVSYTCQGATNLVPDGTYQVRVIGHDTLGHTTTSASTTLIVDNTRPTATNVQAANGGTQRTMDSGDTITFTYSEAMDPTSFIAGWDGSARSTGITARVTNSNAQDRVEIYNGATEIPLTGLLNLNADWVSGSVTFNATVQRTGVGDTFVVTLGSVSAGGGSVRTGVNATANMSWASSNAARDLAGNSATGNTIGEGGGADRDF